jgi:hypothetical protein
MLVHSDVDAISYASIENEIGVFASLFGSSDVFVLWPVSSFELNQKSLDNMVAVHIHNQLYDISAENLDDFHQNFMVQRMLLSDIETFHLLKGDELPFLDRSFSLKDDVFLSLNIS